MAYKRHIDRLPIIPADAKEHNVTCHYCIVGCGYMPIPGRSTSRAAPTPDQNAFGVDLAQAAAGRDRRLVFARRCTTSSSRTARTCTSSSSRTTIAR